MTPSNCETLTTNLRQQHENRRFPITSGTRNHREPKEKQLENRNHREPIEKQLERLENKTFYFHHKIRKIWKSNNDRKKRNLQNWSAKMGGTVGERIDLIITVL